MYVTTTVATTTKFVVVSPQTQMWWTSCILHIANLYAIVTTVCAHCSLFSEQLPNEEDPGILQSKCEEKPGAVQLVKRKLLFKVY